MDWTVDQIMSIQLTDTTTNKVILETTPDQSFNRKPICLFELGEVWLQIRGVDNSMELTSRARNVVIKPCNTNPNYNTSITIYQPTGNTEILCNAEDINLVDENNKIFKIVQ